jgi:hypothetical protein
MGNVTLKTPAFYWHQYNGINLTEFVKRTGATKDLVRDAVRRGWFNEEGTKPEICDMTPTANRPRISYSPEVVNRFRLAMECWALERARKTTRERWRQGIYIVRTEEGPRRYKIGFASDMEKRICGLRGMSPVRLSIVAFISGKDRKMEWKLHRVFRSQRLHGEWFEESPALLQLCERYRHTEEGE